MKLKTIVILFNILVVATFLMVVLMPLFLLGAGYSRAFWEGNWYLAVLFLLVLVVLNWYFLVNGPLFTALEREDWNAVVTTMKRRLHRRGGISPSSLQLLANACVVSGNAGELLAVEEFLRERKPQVIRRSCRLFAVPHLLSNNGEQMQRYFASQIETGDPWMRWGLAFSLLLQGQFEPARGELQHLLEGKDAGLVRALSIYLLSTCSAGDAAATAAADAAKSEFVAAVDRRQWRELVDKERQELHVMVLGRLLTDVERDIYGDTHE